MILIALLLQAAPSVGDTVWLATRVPLEPRQILRPQTWDLGDLGQVLGPPVVELGTDSATVRYPVAFWYPGEHAVLVPGPIVVNPEGRSDTLSARPVRVGVTSVLPARVPRDSLVPRDPAAVVAQVERSLLPVAILELGVALAAVAIGWWLANRRRPRRVAAEPVPPEPDVAAILDRWRAAGEHRVALDGWGRLVAEARRRGDPGGGAAALLEEFDGIRYRAWVDPAEAERLITAAKTWLGASR